MKNELTNESLPEEYIEKFEDMEEIALEYGKDGDFGKLIDKCKSRITEQDYGYIELSLHITDYLSKSDVKARVGNREIVKEASEISVLPHDWMSDGNRIKALSCLLQILEEFEDKNDKG